MKQLRGTLQQKIVNSWNWVSLRLGLEPIKRNVLYHRVTKEPWYYGDGAALVFLFFVLVLTGMFLALTYSPSPETAYASMNRITNESDFGWFVRGLHYWSAGMIVLITLMHVFRHILLGGYLAPREGTWLVGVGLFFLVFTNAFTGYTLRWDERAVYAIRVALNIFYNVPGIGEELVRFVQGGWSLGAETLSRLYAVHVLIVPFSLMALIGYHLYLVVIYGVTTLAEREGIVTSADEQMLMRERQAESEKYGQDFFPFTAAKSGAFALVVFIITLGLTVFFGPRHLDAEANLIRDAMPKEEWWFSWYSAISAYLPPFVAPRFHYLFPVILFLILVSLPFMDKQHNRGMRRRPLAVAVVALILIAIFGLTGLRNRSPWTAWPRDDLPPVPSDVNLSESAEQGRRLFTQYGCFSCHSVGGHGPGFGPNLSALDVRLSRDELRHYVSEPPDDVPMPSYRDRMTDEDLERVIDFVLVAQTFPRKY